MKYTLLRDFLKYSPAEQKSMVLSFTQVEVLIGFNLPDSSRPHRQWWENQTGTKNRPQAQAWLAAGFRVDNEGVNFNKQTVRFIRI